MHDTESLLAPFFSWSSKLLHRLAAAALKEAEPQRFLEAFREAHVSQDARRAGARLVRIMDAMGIEMIPVWDYPYSLQRVRPLPLALFYRGDVSLLEQPGFVAVVGARNAAPGCMNWAHDVGRHVGEMGLHLVSGGARGIDRAAHLGCLAGGGRTVAFLGVQADAVYPAQNVDLFRAILESGGLLASEHPPGGRTFASAHAMRNRFIAGLGDALLVVEARERSGSLGTAAYAKRMGVPIFVAPPGVGGERKGIEALIRRGAVYQWGDKIINDLVVKVAKNV